MTISKTLIATTLSTLLLAAPAFAQDPPPPSGTPGGGPPSGNHAPPSDTAPEDPSSSPQPEPQPEPQPADQTPTNQPGTTSPSQPPVAKPGTGRPAQPKPAKRKKCTTKKGKAAYRKCKKAQRREAARAKYRGPIATKASVFGYMGSASCDYSGAEARLFHAPPRVNSSERQWMVHWNAYSVYSNGAWSAPTDWVGPFYAHSDYPGWFYYGDSWRHESRMGSYSAHAIPSSGNVVGVQWINFQTTGEIAYAYSSTSGCNRSVTGNGQP